MGDNDLSQSLQPLQFVGVVGIIQSSSVWHVARHHANPTTGRSDDASLFIWLSKTFDDIFKTDARQDGDAIPLVEPKVGRLVSEFLKCGKWELLVLLLRLL